MGGDEGDVEAADEEAGIEQPVGAVTGGLPQRLLQRLARPFVSGRGRLAGDAERQHRAERDQPGQHDQGEMIAEIAEQLRGEGHNEELAERTACGDDAECQRPPLRRRRRGPPRRARRRTWSPQARRRRRSRRSDAGRTRCRPRPRRADPKRRGMRRRKRRGPAPCLSASAPMKGWARPKTRLEMATASPNVPRSMPSSILIGGRNRPNAWRTPMAKRHDEGRADDDDPGAFHGHARRPSTRSSKAKSWVRCPPRAASTFACASSQSGSALRSNTRAAGVISTMRARLSSQAPQAT